MFAWIARLFEACGLGRTDTSAPRSRSPSDDYVVSSATEKGENVPPRYDMFVKQENFSGRLTYKAPDTRVISVLALPRSSLAEPNLLDLLRRVSVVIYNHVKAGEREVPTTGQADIFNKNNFRTPIVRHRFIDSPVMAVSGQVFRFEEEVPWISKAPEIEEVHDFLVNVFVQLLLGSECSVVCLIYVERLMALARVPLLGSNWKPILLCACLLASKMWEGLSPWNLDFAAACPEYTAKKIHKLEAEFLRALDWNLGVSSSLYAKYYFALRSLSGQETFRRDYGRIAYRILLEDTTATSQAPDGADMMMFSRSI